MHATGWTRVSRGSHAGHIPSELFGRRPLLPGAGLHERTSSAEGLRLIPLEGRDPVGYRAQDDGVAPPWLKEVYLDPESDSS